MTLVWQHTYANNKAVDKTYKIKNNDDCQRKHLEDIPDKLNNMFEDVLHEDNDVLAPKNLGRVIIDHKALDRPIVFPL